MPLRQRLQVKIDITQLSGRVLDHFLMEELRPEVCIDSDQLRYFERDACRRVANAFRFKGLPATFHAPFLRIDPGSTDKPSRDYALSILLRTVRVAAYFSPLALVCHAGPLYAPNDGLAAWAGRAMEVFGPVAEACAEMGCVLTLENILHSEPDQLLPYFEQLPQARWCFDVGHMHAFSGVDASRWVDVLGPYLGHLHLHDNFGQGDQHLPVGHGSVDYRALMNRLGAHSEPVAATVEVHYRHEFAASLEYLRPIWPWPEQY